MIKRKAACSQNTNFICPDDNAENEKLHVHMIKTLYARITNDNTVKNC